MFHQAREHPADLGSQLTHFGVLLARHVLPVEGNMQVRPHLPAGTLGHGEEVSELLVPAALEPLGDVGHDGYRSPTNLIPKNEIA